MKIVVDASNGMAGKWWPIVFGDLPELSDHCPELRAQRRLRARSQPAGRIEPEATARRGQAAKGGLRASASTATPTGASWWTKTGMPVASDLLTALLAGYFIKAEPGHDGRLRPSQQLGREGRDFQGRRRPAAGARGPFVHEEDHGRLPRPRSAANCPATSTSATTGTATSGFIAIANVLEYPHGDGQTAQQADRAAAPVLRLRRAELPDARTRTPGSRPWPRNTKTAKIDYLDGITDRVPRLVVQRPQEQHRAAAAAEPGGQDQGHAGRQTGGDRPPAG